MANNNNNNSASFITGRAVHSVREAMHLCLLRGGRFSRYDWKCITHDEPLCMEHQKCHVAPYGCPTPETCVFPICQLQIDEYYDRKHREHLARLAEDSPVPPGSPPLTGMSRLPVCGTKEAPILISDPDSDVEISAAVFTPASRVTFVQLPSRSLSEDAYKQRAENLLRARFEQSAMPIRVIRARRIRRSQFEMLMDQASRWYPDMQN